MHIAQIIRGCKILSKLENIEVLCSYPLTYFGSEDNDLHIAAGNYAWYLTKN